MKEEEDGGGRKEGRKEKGNFSVRIGPSKMTTMSGGEKGIDRATA